MDTSSVPATDDVFGDLPDQPIFDRGYVDKLRREGAKYRTEAKTVAEQLAQYNDVFGVYEEPDRAVWMDLARQWVNDPRQAASVMQQIATAVLGEAGDFANVDPTTTPDPAPATDGPLTSEQVQAMVRGEFEAVEQQRAQQQAVENIYAEVRAAGFDPKSRDGFAILWTANNETNGDIKAAIAKFEADRQKVVDEYVQQRAAGRGTIAPKNGVVASASTPIKNMDDARRAADAFLRAQVGE